MVKTINLFLQYTTTFIAATWRISTQLLLLFNVVAATWRISIQLAAFSSSRAEEMSLGMTISTIAVSYLLLVHGQIMLHAMGVVS